MEPRLFKTGDFVYAKSNPDVKLVVKRYIDRIYYCTAFNVHNAPERVYFERELMSQSEKQTT